MIFVCKSDTRFHVIAGGCNYYGEHLDVDINKMQFHFVLRVIMRCRFILDEDVRRLYLNNNLRRCKNHNEPDTYFVPLSYYLRAGKRILNLGRILKQKVGRFAIAGPHPEIIS